MAAHLIRIERAYVPARAEDGYRVLVDRLWPRGVRKDALALNEWCKAVAPSADLRTWFHHDPELWAEFQVRYRAELAGNPELEALVQRLPDTTVTLIVAERDTEHSHALVLREVLIDHAGGRFVLDPDTPAP